MSQNHQLYEYMLPNMDSTFRLFAAHLRSVDASWTYPKHSDRLFEVNLVLEGQQTMLVNRKEYVQSVGDILLLKPGDIHQGKCTNGPSMTYYCLHFDVDDPPLRALLHRNRRVFYNSESTLTKEIGPTVRRLIDMTITRTGETISHRMLTLSLAFELFAKLSDCVAAQEMSDTKSNVTVLAESIADALEAYVEQIHIDTPFPKDIVHHIAEQTGYSTSTCARVFHQVYGISPRQHLSTLKLRKAKLLLIESNTTIDHISRVLGYGDIAHFSRQFKRWTGESPRDYRAKYSGR